MCENFAYVTFFYNSVFYVLMWILVPNKRLFIIVESYTQQNFKENCLLKFLEIQEKKCLAYTWSNRGRWVSLSLKLVLNTKFFYISILEPPLNQIWLAYFYQLKPFTLFQPEVDHPMDSKNMYHTPTAWQPCILCNVSYNSF